MTIRKRHDGSFYMTLGKRQFSLHVLHINQGMFTEAHGIIDNTMYDLERSEQFLRGSTSLDGTWWGGEPVSV